MMEAAPPPPFEMAEPHLLFEFLIVALNAPAQLGDVDEIVKGDVTCKGRKPVFGRRVLTLWPFDQQPFFRSAFSQIIVAMRYSHTHPRKARGQHIACALAPLDRTPCSLRQSKRKLLDRDRLMLCVPPDELGWPSVAGPFFGRQRPRAPCPHARVRHDAGDIAQRQRIDSGAQIGVAAIARVHQHHATRKLGLAGHSDLLQRDLGFGLEADILRHAGLAPTFAVIRPVFRQIKTIGHRQAGVMIGDRQRHRHLTIVLLAELPAVLPRHPDRVPPLLGKARIVDDPRLDRPLPLDRRQHHLAHLAQYPFVRPAALADKMQQRLVLRRRARRSCYCRHRLHALALARHHQTHAVVA